MDHMSQYDAERFAAYLAEYSNYTHHAPGHESVIHKRDDDDDHHSKLWNLLHGHYHSVRLPDQEQKTLHDLMAAVHDRKVTQYIDQVGYGAIFGLLEFSGHYADDIGNMINGAIAAEAAAEANNLTGYIADNGYGPIFGFLEHLDYFHANQVYDYLTKALESEKAAAATTAAPSN